MFSLDVVDSDRFMEMGVSARELYFQLGMRGDDDGFVGNPKRIMRSVGASEDDLKILQAKEFIHEFESGVIVILDWRLNNNLRNDRYKPTIYTEERKQLRFVFEQEMGFLSSTSMEELRKWLFEDNYSAEVIKLALKEAVLNRKITLNYIKAILRNWRNDGITSAQAVQKNKEEREASKTTSKVWNGPDIPLDGPWNGTEG